MVAAVLMSHCVARSENLCTDADPFFQQLLANQRPVKDDDPAATGEDLDWTQWVNRVADDPSNWAVASDQLTEQFLKVGDLKVDYDDYLSALVELTSITPLLLLVERGVDLVEIMGNLCKELDYPEDRVRFTAVAGQDYLNWTEVEDCVRR